MEKEKFAEELKLLIEQHEEISIANYDQELDIDSFTMMLIITFTEEKIKVTLNMEVLDFDDFKSINVLTDMIYAQKAKA